MLLWEVFNLDSWLHFALDKSFLLNPLNKLKIMTRKMIGALQFQPNETYTQPCPDGGYGEKHYGTLTLQPSKRWQHIDVDPPRTKHSRLFFSSLSALSLSLELRPLPPRKPPSVLTHFSNFSLVIPWSAMSCKRSAIASCATNQWQCFQSGEATWSIILSIFVNCA